MRESANELHPATGRLMNGYDYDRQAWVVDGRYVRCGHVAGGTDCQCYGRFHEGENTPRPEVPA